MCSLFFNKYSSSFAGNTGCSSTCPTFPLAIVVIYMHANITPTTWSLTHEHSLQHAHISLGLGLARCHGTTRCRQIKFNQFDFGTQLCCSQIHELACCWHSIKNSLAREVACSCGILRTHVKASGKARQRYLPAVRWKVWRPKIEGDI